MKKSKKNNAAAILHHRYIRNNAKRQTALQEEQVNTEVARMIYELRAKERLNQKELAELVGTTQSVISRMENADYAGHSLSMLTRIARALNRRIK